MTFPRRHRPGSAHGYALVLILAILVLCVPLVIYIFQSSRYGLQSSAAFNNAAQARAHAQKVLNLVYAQIRDATTTNQRLSDPPEGRDTWASQPGTIRRYTNEGELAELYKLYSSALMRTTDPNLSGDVPAKWFEKPTEYVDLNAPVTIQEATADDPAVLRYPILDPRVRQLTVVGHGVTDGFSISGAPVASASPIDAAPMPARWIYILEDGTLCQLDDSRIGKNNPIIGRVAFWTDDESAKVNINTASPASRDAAWDIPRSLAREDADSGIAKNLPWFQPAQNEYQRYPGHPATVSLRPILGTLYGTGSEYFALSPRYRWGGSEEASKRIDAARASLMTNKEDRLYSSVDEMLFTSTRSRSSLDPEAARQLGFFLTAQSRASDLNLFGQPRVSIWPIHDNTTDEYRTPFDRLLAFCSTVGGKPFYFTRKDPLSQTADYDEIPRNKELYAYLQSLTSAPVPGFGGIFAEKYEKGTDERDQILTEIFDYIRCTNLNETFSGRASNFKSYTPDWKTNAGFSYADASWGAYYEATGKTVSAPGMGAGFVVPITINDTFGAGRFPVLSQAALWFITRYDPAHPPQPGDETVADSLLNPTRPRFVEAMLVLQTTSPMHGFMPWWPSAGFNIRVEGCTVGASVGSNTGTLFAPATHKVNHPPMLLELGNQTTGGVDGSTYLAGGRPHNATGWGGSTVYPFFSTAIPVGDPATDTLSIVGGTIEMTFRIGDEIVRTYNLSFPSINGLALPVEANNDYRRNTPLRADDTYIAAKPWWFNRFLGGSGVTPFPGDVIRSLELKTGDARHAMMSANDIPATLFAPHQDYSDASKRFAHSLRGAVNVATGATRLEGGRNGRYFSDIDYEPSTPVVSVPSITAPGMPAPPTRQHYRTHTPDVPSTVSDILDSSRGWMGDYDNGIAHWPDGSFLNKPDEGMRNAPSTFTQFAPYLVPFWSLGDGLFSPLRQVPSAVMFGSLPTGVKADIPWRTLLFCPNPVAGTSHKGFEKPADSLLLDLFTMPVVEPYAISEPFSTAGRINMNYAIAPYSYIRRAIPWYSLLETIKLMAIPDSAASTYKRFGGVQSNTFRSRINIPETLRQLDSHFATHEIYRSPTQLCSLFLIPDGKQLSEISDFWEAARLTGDNSREKPYAELYPKLTTQSNTYRVHVRAQVLPKASAAPEQTDFRLLAEYRGSYLIERYVNPYDPRFKGNGGTVDPDHHNLNELYQIRVLETRQFNP